MTFSKNERKFNITKGAIVIPLAIEFIVNLMIYFGSWNHKKKKIGAKKKQNGGENQDGRQA
jgi:hypothetical protein